MDNSEFNALLGALYRIAGALESLARGSEPEALNLVKPIGEFKSFDWSSIGASVVQQDSDGATHLEHGGYIWTRRSPKNKYDAAIWFSRPAGKDPEGNTAYLRLITFKQIGEADRLPEKAAALLDPAATGRPAAAPDPSKQNGNGGQHAPVTAGSVAAGLASGMKPPSQAPEDQKKEPEKQPAAKRPYTPDQLRAQLEARRVGHIGKIATDEQRKKVATLLEKCFAGDEKAESKRQAVQIAIYNRDSLLQLFDAEILAALDWLKPVTDSGGDIKPDPVAVGEARMVYQEALKVK